MIIQEIAGEFTVCRVDEGALIDISRPFTFAARTDEEFSLVCPTESVPEKTICREDGWRMFRIAGTLDFWLTGILSRIAGLLAQNKIPLFAVSTYNTDYVLVKDEHFKRALYTLSENGYEISR